MQGKKFVNAYCSYQQKNCQDDSITHFIYFDFFTETFKTKLPSTMPFKKIAWKQQKYSLKLGQMSFQNHAMAMTHCKLLA